MQNENRYRHEAVALGGTFDILHLGHERLFERAFELGKFVFIGITSDSLVARLRKNHSVRPFDARVRDVKDFLRSRGWLARAKIVTLRDRYGPVARRRRLDALVVSEETRQSGRKVNSLRKDRGLPPLRIYVVKLVRDGHGQPISGTRIRRHEIDSTGKPM